jgi:hypothetical protein
MNKEDFIRINTPADGNCLIHSILRASYKDYINSDDDNFKSKLAKHFRNIMGNYIMEADTDYATIESVVDLVMKSFDVLKPRKFMEFLEAMYNYTDKELAYPKEPISNMSITEYKDVIKYEDSIYFETANELYEFLETKINRKVIEFRVILEDKLDNKLYLPIHFNKGVIEAVLEEKEVPEGLYHDLPFNCRLFTYCNGQNLIRFAYEYNKLEEMLYLRGIPDFFRSREFIGDSDVLSYIPDIMQINIIIIDFDDNNVIHIYETDKSENYIIINNIRNVHFETIGLKVNEKVYTIFDKEDDFIQDIIKSRRIY